jgi:alkanesulfonate monooxygenase SsuD/methylene tetrahydromethanopterin reductase-like flavin-dependent oxidoreductase (luciferase family)
MQFGLFSNGERSNRIASISWDEDLEEIRLADKLGFCEAWVAEHPGGNRVDAQPCADLFIVKAAALTKRLRFGPAIRPLPFYHPAQVATEAAVCDHLTGGRYMAGFGGGIGGPGAALRSRGINVQTRDDARAMMHESIDFILRCWAEPGPFDFEGRFWQAQNIKTQPKPLQQPRMPVGLAVTESLSSAELAGRLGFLPLHSFHDVASSLSEHHRAFVAAAKAAGRKPSRNDIRITRYIHVSDSVKKAKEEIRDSMTPHIERRKRDFAWQFNRCMPPSGKIEDVTFDYLVDSGVYFVGDPDTVAHQVKDLYREVGGFGVLLLTAGKDIGSRQQRARSLRLFAQHVAPRLVDTDPDREGELEAVF